MKLLLCHSCTKNVLSFLAHTFNPFSRSIELGDYKFEKLNLPQDDINHTEPDALNGLRIHSMGNVTARKRRTDGGFGGGLFYHVVPGEELARIYLHLVDSLTA